jgi:pilus assembly protein CpaE
VPSGGQLEITRKDFETSIERRVDMVIPFDPKTAIQAAKLGKTLAEAARSSRVGSMVRQLADRVSSLDDFEEVSSSDSGSGSLMGKLGGLKALVSKKPEKAEA